jgi:cholesterol transport system auxiliary component
VRVSGANSQAGRAAIVMAMALCVGACGGLGSLGGGSKAAPPTYDLTVSQFPRPTRAPRGLLVVADPTALAVLDSEKIVVRPAAGEVAALADAQWSDRLPRLVQARIVQAFENANRLRAVGRPNDHLTADYQLLIDIRAFQIVATEVPTGDVEIAAKIVGDRSGRIAAARIFRASVPAEATAGPGAVAAIDEAFTKVTNELVLWVARAI